MSAYNNSITLVGNLGRDPEIKKTSTGKTVAILSLAVARGGDRENPKTNWVRVEAWHDTARGVESLSKGDKVIVFGELMIDSVEQPDGSTKNYTKVVARNVGKDLSIRKEESEGGRYEENEGDDDFPF